MSRVHDILSSFGELTVAELGELDELIKTTAEEIGEGDAPGEAAALLAAASAHETVNAARTAPGASRIRRMAAAAGRPAPGPEARGETGHGAVLLAAGSPGMPAGAPIESREQLAKTMSDLLNGMNRDAPPRGGALVASARWNYPSARRLHSLDWQHNERVFAGAIGPRPFLSLPLEALVASGGICSPVNVDYSVPGWATAGRPIRDGLPAFQADRGGITYVPPGDIATYASATGIWAEATDANPAGATKPVMQVVCGSPVTSLVDAVTVRVGFGNMMARMAPEQMAAAADLAIAMNARVAEINLLEKIAASCVADVTSATLLGATRDFITVIHQVVAGYRSVHRIPRSVKFTAIFPDWVRDMIAVDRAREIGHGEDASLTVTEQDVNDMLSAHGVNPIWHLDGQSSSQLSGAGGVSQLFSTQSASGAVNPFPTKIVWYVFPEGAFQFLDGGRLDLGVVRDSSLDSTNDFETFTETFEGVAFRGFSSGAYQMVTTTGALGGTAGTVSTTGSPA